MMETQESARSHRMDGPMSRDYVRGPPRKYEKLIQKLESDIRGHIRVSLISKGLFILTLDVFNY